MALATEQDLTPKGLLELFTVAELRRHILPLEFVRILYGVALSKDAKEAHTETLRVEELLRRSKNATWAVDLFAFHEWLVALGLPLRTRRLYLSSASGLMAGSSLKRMAEVDEQVLRNHLTKVPGARNNLLALVRFLAHKLGQTASMPSRDSAPRALPGAAKRLRSHLRKIHALGSSAPTAVYDRAVAAAFHTSLAELKDGTWWGEIRDGKPVLCSVEETVCCPSELVDMLRHWIERRQAGTRHLA